MIYIYKILQYYLALISSGLNYILYKSFVLDSIRETEKFSHDDANKEIM